VPEGQPAELWLWTVAVAHLALRGRGGSRRGGGDGGDMIKKQTAATRSGTEARGGDAAIRLYHSESSLGYNLRGTHLTFFG
jgi:hypothetical protein